jgi:hypothetical protein
VVAKSAGLRSLHVRVTGHERIYFIATSVHYYGGKLGECFNNFIKSRSDPQSKICSDLIVAGTSGVQFSPYRTRHLNQASFNIHVDVFFGRVPNEIP